MKARWLLMGAGLGAGIMYMFDPDRGRRRRAVARDQMIRSLHRTSRAVDITSEDLANRARGLKARYQAWRQRDYLVDDITLAERIRSQLGRVVAHPGAIEVKVSNGCAVLRGAVLESEADRLVQRVRHVHGVCDVANELDIHATAAGVPSLQGGAARRPRSGLMRSHWSPTTRLLAGVAGGALTLYGMGWHGLRRMMVGGAGMSLLARAASNTDLRRLSGVGAQGRGERVHRDITVNAPVERVFDLWSHYENFPPFMSHVRSVERLDDHRTHWCVDGPAGTVIEWDAITTAFEPNRLIAWKTLPGTSVEHSGEVHFTAAGDGTTHVDVWLEYAPPAGVLGHAVATLLGADPGSRMQDDLLRMKTFVETNRPPHDAAQPQPQREYH